MSTTLSGSTLTVEAQAQLRHDLRTPLNHIIGYTEMLLEDATGDALAERRTRLELALAAARHALELINAALGSARRIVPGDVARLFDALQEPRKKIVAAVSGLELPETDGDDVFNADLKKILSAAAQSRAPR